MYSFINCTCHRILLELWKRGGKVNGLVSRLNVTCVQGYQIFFIIMNNQLCFQWPLCICIPSYRHNDMSVAVTDIKIHSVTIYYTVTVVTPLTFVLWLCQGFGCASLMQAAQFGGCVCYCGLSLVFGCWNLIYVVQDRAGEV